MRDITVPVYKYLAKRSFTVFTLMQREDLQFLLNCTVKKKSVKITVKNCQIATCREILNNISPQ